jgi:hypothetical protein
MRMHGRAVNSKFAAVTALTLIALSISVVFDCLPFGAGMAYLDV